MTARERLLQSMRRSAPFVAQVGEHPEALDKERINAYRNWLWAEEALAQSRIAANRFHDATVDEHITAVDAFHDYLKEQRRFDQFLERTDPLTVRIKVCGDDDGRKALYANFCHWIDQTLGLAAEVCAEDETLALLDREGREKIDALVDDAGVKLAATEQARADYQQAKRSKTVTKREVLAFLGSARRHLPGSMQTLSLPTAQLVQRLDEEMVRLADQIERVEARRARLRSKRKSAQAEIAADGLEARTPPERIAQLRTLRALEWRLAVESAYLARRTATAATYIVRLRTEQAAKSSARSSRDVARSRAVSAVSRADREARRGRAAFAEAREQHFGAIGSQAFLGHEREKVTELYDQLDECLRQHEKLAPALFDVENQIRAASADAAKGQLEARKLELEAQRATLVEEQLRLSAQLITANERYGGVARGVVTEHNARIEQMQRLETLAVTATTLNAYCSVYDMGFDKILGIGLLIQGDLSTRQSVLGQVVAAAPVACSATDTGSMGVSFKLGISYGINMAGAGAAEVGLALQYDAGISNSDDRRFRSVSSFRVIAFGEAKVPVLARAAIEATLYRDKTVFVFQDAYHWAAWVTRKWAHAVAIYKACDRYCLGNPDRFDKQPTPQELRQFQERAAFILRENEHLSQVMEEIAQYNNLPITRVQDKALLESVKASVALADGALAAASEVARETTATFYRAKRAPSGGDVVTTSTGQTQLQSKRVTTWTGALSGRALVLDVQVGFTDIEHHPVPDNDGLYVNVKVGLTGLSGWSLGAQPASAAPPEVLTQFEKRLKDIAGLWGQIKEALGGFTSTLGEGGDCPLELSEVGASVGGARLELNYLYSVVDSVVDPVVAGQRHKDGKWVLQYSRLVFERGSSLSVDLPVGSTGVTLKGSASMSFSRTYLERPGSNTMSYWLTVYNGLHNIGAQDAHVVSGRSTARPPAASGEALWTQYKRSKERRLQALFSNIATEGSWVRREIDSANCPVAKARAFKDACAHYKTRGQGFSEAVRCMEEYLAAVGSADRDSTETGPHGWKDANPEPQDAAPARCEDGAVAGNWIDVLNKAATLMERTGRSRDECLDALFEHRYNLAAAAAALAPAAPSAPPPARRPRGLAVGPDAAPAIRGRRSRAGSGSGRAVEAAPVGAPDRVADAASPLAPAGGNRLLHRASPHGSSGTTEE